MRRHLFRSIARVTTLLAADLGGYLVARAAIRAVRDQALLGSALARALQTAVPLGSLGGWQLAAALLLGLAVTGNYGRGDRRRNSAALFAGVALGTALSVWGPLWQSGLQTVAMQFAATTLAMGLAVVAERRVLDWLVLRLVPGEHQAERVVFVGEPGEPVGRRVEERLAPRRGGMLSLGWVSTNGIGHSGVLGRVTDFWDLIQRHEPDTVVLCGHLADDEFEAVVSASIAAGCRLLSVPRYEGLAEVRPGLVWERGLPLMELTIPSLRARQLLVKRVIDLIVSAAGLVLLAPVVGLLALAIKLDSPGPIFFSQRRVGLGGRPFRMLKFRTMRLGADAEKAELAHLNHTGDPRLFKIPNDPRVTRVGALLRRWSIDELPQLWNVFVGHMSLVGPRPFFESDLEAYLDHHFVRLGAKPGITGLWQVNGRSSVVDFEEVVRLDREYIERWSLWLDLQILARTVPTVVRRVGAF